jgi:nucleotide-binding universal stress UspA family protein
VDPFHDHLKTQRKTLRAITEVYGAHVSVVPASVLRAGSYNPHNQQFLEQWPQLVDAARQSLERLVDGIEIRGLERPRLLSQESASVSDAVRAIVHFAIAEGAEAIAVCSHGRSGLSRWILGSFAETLVLQSPLPVLVVGPKEASDRKMETFLFPTDFSAPSQAVFRRLLDVAVDAGARVRLFHKIEYLYPALGYPFVVPPVSADSIEALTNEVRDRAASWLKLAEAAGVRAEAVVESGSESTLDCLLRAAAAPGTVIAMAAQSGPVSSALVGSLTRQTLRAAPCPVLVLRAEQEANVKRFVEEALLMAYAYTAKPLIV